MTYKDVIYKLNNNIPFTFSRYGVAEWACMLGEDGVDVNGTVYTQELRLDLQSALKEKRTENDFIGLSKQAMDMYPSKIEAMNKAYGFNWVDADMFAKQWYNEGLESLFISLEKYSVLLIAPQYYGYFQKEMAWGHCRIDQHDWYNKNYEAILYLLEKSLLFQEPSVYIWAAGMGAKPAIQRLRKTRPDVSHIDIGSALDPYTEYATRKYHLLKNPNLKQLL